MLDKIVSSNKISKEEYSSRLSQLEPSLFHMQWKAKEAKIPTIILLEGFYGTGIGIAIRALTTRMDPRSIRVHPMREPRGLENERPWLHRFWMRLPNHGEIAIFDTSWYRHIINDQVKERISNKEVKARLKEVIQLERMLVDDGHVLVKIFFHVSQAEQARRLKKAENNPKDFWDVSQEEWKQNKEYKQWANTVNEVLKKSATPKTPWILISANSRRQGRIKMIETVVQAMEERIQIVAPDLVEGPAPAMQHKTPEKKKENGPVKTDRKSSGFVSDKELL